MKLVTRASAAALLLAMAGGAHAAVTTTITLEAGSGQDGTGAAAYASELQYVDAAPLAGAANALNFVSTLGFGVSNGQTRYIRIDYGNATLDAAHAAVIGTDLEISSGENDPTASVVAGGAIGDSYVIYQITAGDDYSAATTIDFAVPSLRVASNASPVTATMTLHETAVSAVAGSSGDGLLSTRSGYLATFSAGLNWTLTTGTNTAAVETEFKEFCLSASDCTANNAVTTKALGKLVYNVNSVNKRDGTGVALADLVSAATVTVAGDFTAAAAANSVFLDTDGDGTDCNTNSLAGTLDGSKTSATFTVGTTARGTTGVPAPVCYTVNGTTEIPEQTITAALDVTAAANTTTADVAAATLGTIDHDGTELQAPWVSVADGWTTRFLLTNEGSEAASGTYTVMTESGVSCTSAAVPVSIPAGGVLNLDAKTLCSTITGGQRIAVTFVIAAPSNTIQGVYNIVNNTTGVLTTYPMLRPGTN